VCSTISKRQAHDQSFFKKKKKTHKDAQATKKKNTPTTNLSPDEIRRVDEENAGCGS